MPAFLRFYPGLSPRDFYSLTLPEFQAMYKYILKVQEAMNA